MPVKVPFFTPPENPVSTTIPPSVASEDAFVVSSVYTPETLGQTYELIKENLTLYNNDSLHNQWVAEQSNAALLAQEQALAGIIASPEIDINTKVEAVKQQELLPPIEDTVDNETSYRDYVLFNELQNSQDGSQHEQEIVQDKIDINSLMSSRAQSTRAIISEIDAAIADSNADTGQAFLDMMKLAIPFYNNTLYAQISAKLAPKWAEQFKEVNTLGPLAYVMPGELTEEWKDIFKTLPSEQRMEFMEDLVAATQQATEEGWVGRNDFAKFAVLQDMMDELRVDPNSFDLDRVLDNTFGVFDILFARGMYKWLRAAGRGVVLASRAYGNARLLSDQIAEESARLIAAGIADPTIAKELGATSEELAALTVLPAVQGAPASASKHSAAIAEIVARQIASRNIVQKTINSIDFLSPAEKRAFHDRVLENIPSFTNHQLYTGSSQVLTRTTDDALAEASTFRLGLMFGYDEKVGFSTAFEALRQAKKYGYDGVKVYKKDPATGNIREIQPYDNHYKGEFFYRVESDYRYGAIEGEILGDTFAPLAGASRGWAPPTTLFERRFNLAALQAGDKFRAIETRLMKDFLKYWNKARIDRHQANTIIQLLEQESRQKKVIPIDELVKDHGFTPEMLQARQAIKGTFDTLYSISNTKMYNFFKGEGYMWYKNGTGKYSTPVKLFTEDEAKGVVRTAYDPETNAIIKKLNIKDLYAQGKKVGEMYHPETKGKHQTSYVIIDETKGSLGKLPPQVLEYHNGYYTRYYKGKTFIFELVKDGKVNGVTPGRPVRKVVGVAADETEAKIALDNLRTKHPGKEFDYQTSANMSAMADGERAAMRLEFTLDRRATSPIFGERGAHLIDHSTGNLAETYSPIASMRQAVKTVSRAVNFDDLLETARSSWVKKYGQGASPIAPSRTANGTDYYFPASKGDIRTEGNINKPMLKEALAEWEYINFLAGYRSGLKHWGMLFDGLAGLMSGHPTAARGLAWVGSKDPVSLWRSFAFTVLIAMSPIRQVLLQSQQFVGLFALNPKYAMSGKWMWDYAVLVPMLAAAERPSLYKLAKQATKLSMFTEEEANALVRGFKEMGLSSSIDAHLIGEDALKAIETELEAGIAGRVAAGAANLVTALPRVGKKVGFDLGEFNNMMMSYLFAVSEFRAANPTAKLTNPRNISKIAGRTRELALAVTPEGGFLYQRGWASAMFQFFQIQHKVANVMLGALPGQLCDKLGNRAFTKAQARRYAIGQVAFYGAAGTGLAQAVEWVGDKYGLWEYIRNRHGEKVQQDVEAALVGGMTDYVVGKLVQDGSNISVAKSLAPASGLFFEGLGNTFIETIFGNRSFYTLILGAGLNPASRLHNALVTSGDIVAVEGFSPESLLSIGKSLAHISSFGSRYFRMRLGQDLAKHLGSPMYLDSKYRPVMEATNDALEASGYFGFDSRDWEEFRKVNMDSKLVQKEARDTAKAIYERFNRFITATLDEVPPDLYLEKLEEFSRTELWWMGLAEGEDWSNMVKESLIRYITEDIGEPESQRFMERLGQIIIGDPEEDAGKMLIKRAQRAGATDNQTASMLIKIIEDAEMEQDANIEGR